MGAQPAESFASRAILRDPRLVPPDLRTEGHTLPFRGGQVLPLDPSPLHFRTVEQATPRGYSTDFLALWRNEDAARCRACPEARCTYDASAAGVGSCVIRRAGRGAEALATIPESWKFRTGE